MRSSARAAKMLSAFVRDANRVSIAASSAGEAAPARLSESSRSRLAALHRCICSWPGNGVRQPLPDHHVIFEALTPALVLDFVVDARIGFDPDALQRGGEIERKPLFVAVADHDLEGERSAILLDAHRRRHSRLRREALARASRPCDRGPNRHAEQVASGLQEHRRERRRDTSKAKRVRPRLRDARPKNNPIRRSSFPCGRIVRW